MKHLVVLFIVCAFVQCFTACVQGKPKGVMSESKMENVLYSYHVAKATANARLDSSTYYSHYLTDQVLKKYGVSKEDFNTSLLWYNRHTDVLFKIYDCISARMEKEASSLGVVTSTSTLYSNLTAEGDTANVWNGKSFYLLSSVGLNNRMTFRVKADTAFYPEDKYVFHFVSHFVYAQGARDAYISLRVKYNNDSIGTMDSHLNADGEYSLSLSTAKRKIKYVEGFVYLNAPWSDSPKLLFLQQPSLIRFHKQKSVPKTAADSLANKTQIPLHPASAKDSDTAAQMPVSIHGKPVPRRISGFQRHTQN